MVRSFVRWCPPFLFVLYDYSTNFVKFFPTISLTLSLSQASKFCAVILRRKKDDLECVQQKPLECE